MTFDTLVVNPPSIGGYDEPNLPGRMTAVAGYTLQRCIGNGGYGEVWEAVGPGGLPKAVKILHGRFDGRQAETELKALELLRQLRHPFLINVERIEVIDGQLIVVMELAECSLEQRFAALTNDNACGIPRDELLRYLGDAAEALDFMYEQHGLQHLDVKPGNLLIQSGHVKVGDFGLTKNLQQSHVSVVTGFTPVYAAPELFEGKPTRSSDQYALAVVYQIMLTGTPPFAGRTMAHLASQHLRGNPDLSPLPPSDRRVVGRALTKHATARFPTCVDFVKSLIEQGKSRENGPCLSPQSRPKGTNDHYGANGTPAASDTDLLPEIIYRSAKPLPTVNLETTNVAFRPTLFLGVGGLGGRVIQALRQRFQTEYGNGTRLPAFGLLSLDSDVAAQRELLFGDARLSEDEVLPIPLRSSAEYRAEAPSLLPWISRRWLFNIPRSHQTEGIRSLGRLAMVDHADLIRLRLRNLIRRVLSADSLESTSRTIGLSGDPTGIDVVLVGSATGGMSGGAIMDLAYLTKSLVEAEHSTVGRTLGLILLPTPSQKRTDQLSQANALAWFREWKRFSQSIHGFPGDASCLLPPAESGPFDDTYLIPCEECGTNGLQESVEEVAEYCFRRTSTRARAFFEISRDQDATSADKRAEGMRLFGLFGSAIGKKRTTMTGARRLSAVVLAEWIGDITNLDNRRGALESTSPDMTPAERTAEELEATVVVGFVSAQCRRLIGEHIRPLVTQAWQCPVPKNGERRLQSVFDAVHTLVRTTAPQPSVASNAPALRHSLAEPRKVLLEAFPRFIEQACTELVEGRRSIAGTDGLLRRLAKDAAGSQLRIQSALDTLKIERQKLVDEFGRLSTSGIAIAPDLGNSPSEAEALRKTLDSAVSNFAMLECCLAIHEGVAEALGRGVDDLKQRQIAIAANLTQCIALQKKLAAASSGGADEPYVDTILGGGPNTAERSEDVVELAAQARHLLKAVLPAVVTGEGMELGSFSLQLLREAEQFVAKKKSGTQAPSPNTETDVERLVRKLPNAGGRFRCFAVGPESAAAQDGIQALEERLQTTAARITIEAEETLLGFEAWNLEPEILLHHVLGNDPVVTDLATRLHSRIDVNW